MQRNIQELITNMTLEEKASLCSGLDFWHTKPVPRLGIPSILMTDGPHWLRKQKEGAGLLDSVPATCFPAAATMACSWDPELMEEVGTALGEECQAEGVSILLGPAVNMKRSPLCGRNFEYYSEDPYLSSEMAAAFIKGVQNQGVGTSLKHFAANNQEYRRMTTDAVVEERTLREIYLASFEGPVKQAQPWTVMCAYNQLNGEFCSENPYLLTEVLKDEWGHEGFVVSDWGAVNERVKGLAAGLDLEMPGNGGMGDRKIIEAVQSGRLSMDVLDKAVERLLTVIFKAVDQKREHATYDAKAHHELARKVARESMVLLKNEDAILPLPREGTLAVIGGLAESPRYQSGGSSHVQPTRLEDIREEIQHEAGEAATVLYAQGYRLDTDERDEGMIEEAIRVAAMANAVVLFAGLPERYESEGYDRSHLRLPDSQSELIEAVARVNRRTVVVLCNGSSVEMPWLDQVQGVLESYLGGQAFGRAVADLLFGRANPCGKLAETFPMKLSHNPSHLNFPGEGDRVEYREGLFIGYRYYDAKDIEPLFPFGYGLSYTSFDYSNLTLDKRDMQDDETLGVTVSVKNTGSVAGKEIVELYVRDVEATVIRPLKELKGFAKVELQPGEETTVTFTLGKRAFAYYNAGLKDWHVETGDFAVCIGRSSREIVLKDHVHVQSTKVVRRTVTRNSTLGDLLADPATAPIAEELLRKSLAQSGLEEALKDSPDMMMAMMRFIPLRNMVSFSQGTYSEEDLGDLIKTLNGIREKRP